jgi:SAM-dependent methyltransferase
MDPFDGCLSRPHRWISEENRIQWHGAIDVLHEQEFWDSWARVRDARTQHLDVEGWFGSRTFAPIPTEYPLLRNVAGWRILDIGGTCLDAVKFLRSGVQRVDQVEISPASQRLAAANLEASGVCDWQDSVVFHTTAAEELPFQDETFDLVFSRATIHHTDRTKTIPEIHRVVKEGGALLMVEAYLSEPARRLMRLRRNVAHADRGTDWPISTHDIRHIAARYNRVVWRPYNVLSLLWSQTGHKTRSGRRITPKIWALDLRLGSLGGLARWAGNQCWVLAMK